MIAFAGGRSPFVVEFPHFTVMEQIGWYLIMRDGLRTRPTWNRPISSAGAGRYRLGLRSSTGHDYLAGHLPSESGHTYLVLHAFRIVSSYSPSLSTGVSR